MAWTVVIPKKVQKQADKIRKVRPDIWAAFRLLVRNLEEAGPTAPQWHHFGKLAENVYHCHLNKGTPRYVAVWSVEKQIVTMEMCYVGTHEGADYKKFC